MVCVYFMKTLKKHGTRNAIVMGLIPREHNDNSLYVSLAVLDKRICQIYDYTYQRQHTQTEVVP